MSIKTMLWAAGVLAVIVVLLPFLICLFYRDRHPDLVISAPANLSVTPTTVAGGSIVSVPNWTVSNVGNVASNEFKSGLYLSTDATITAADLLLVNWDNRALEPRASFHSDARMATVPAVSPGNYFIGILVDRTNTTPEGCEGGESNNFISTPLTVLRAQTIAFSSQRNGGTSCVGGFCTVPGEIYVMNADGTDLRQLTHNPAIDIWPALSPTTGNIAFTSNRDGNFEIYLWDPRLVTNINGPFVNLTNHPAQDGYPTWSPDGYKIAFVSEGRDFQDFLPCSEIYVMDLRTHTVNRLTSDCINAAGGAAYKFSPAWSPDGSKIAFERLPGNAFLNDIYMVDVQTRVMTQLPNAHGRDPAWSPDGSLIAFSSLDSRSNDFVLQWDISVIDVNRPLHSIVLSNPGGGFSGHVFLSPAWSPEGSRIAFRGSHGLYVMLLNSTRNYALDIGSLTDGAGDDDPSWAWGPTYP